MVKTILSLIRISHYQFFSIVRRDRQSRGVGVAFHIADHFAWSIPDTELNPSVECLCVDVHMGTKTTRICNFYRPPSAPFHLLVWLFLWYHRVNFGYGTWSYSDRRFQFWFFSACRVQELYKYAKFLLCISLLKNLLISLLTLNPGLIILYFGKQISA